MTSIPFGLLHVEAETENKRKRILSLDFVHWMCRTLFSRSVLSDAEESCRIQEGRKPECVMHYSDKRSLRKRREVEKGTDIFWGHRLYEVIAWGVLGAYGCLRLNTIGAYIDCLKKPPGAV